MLLFQNPARQRIPRAGLVCHHDFYDTTRATTTVPDKTGKYPVTFGAAGAAPTWEAGGLGLAFVDNDYAYTGDISEVLLAGPWTAVLALKSQYDLFSVLWSLSSGTANGAEFRTSSATAMQVRWRDTATALAAVLTGGLTDETPYVVSVVANTNLFLRVLPGAVSAGADARNPTGTPHIEYGRSLNTVSYADDVVMYAGLLYSRALSTAEQDAIRLYLKTLWAGRGVSIT